MYGKGKPLSRLQWIDLLWPNDAIRWPRTGVCIGLGYGSLPGDTKPLPELKLTSCLWGSVAFTTWKQQMPKLMFSMSLKITLLILLPRLPGTNELRHIVCVFAVCSVVCCWRRRSLQTMLSWCLGNTVRRRWVSGINIEKKIHLLICKIGKWIFFYMLHLSKEIIQS